jgi:hypothetical protein
MVPNAKNGHKGRFFIQFSFSFFGFAWRGGDVKGRHVPEHLPFGSISRREGESAPFVGNILPSSIKHA